MNFLVFAMGLSRLRSLYSVPHPRLDFSVLYRDRDMLTPLTIWAHLCHQNEPNSRDCVLCLYSVWNNGVLVCDWGIISATVTHTFSGCDSLSSNGTETT